jgi:hypothetical protein
MPVLLDYQSAAPRRRPTAREAVLGTLFVAVATVACVLEYRSYEPRPLAPSRYRSAPAQNFPFKRMGGPVREFRVIDTSVDKLRELVPVTRTQLDAARLQLSQATTQDDRALAEALVRAYASQLKQMEVLIEKSDATTRPTSPPTEAK